MYIACSPYIHVKRTTVSRNIQHIAYKNIKTKNMPYLSVRPQEPAMRISIASAIRQLQKSDMHGWIKGCVITGDMNMYCRCKNLVQNSCGRDNY